jgi:hypothetical protein
MRRVYPAADFPLDLGFRGLGDFKGLAKKYYEYENLLMNSHIPGHRHFAVAKSRH